MVKGLSALSASVIAFMLLSGCNSSTNGTSDNIENTSETEKISSLASKSVDSTVVKELKVEEEKEVVDEVKMEGGVKSSLMELVCPLFLKSQLVKVITI